MILMYENYYFNKTSFYYYINYDFHSAIIKLIKNIYTYSTAFYKIYHSVYPNILNQLLLCLVPNF